MPKAIAELQKLGIKPAPEDLPEPLGWEQALWSWYCRLCRQWRTGMSGPIGLDLTVWLPVIEHQGWDLDTSLELLSVIEDGFLAKSDATEAPSNDTRH